ncbi:MAG: hypothetical protein ACR2IJ_07315 [Fluviibacter sp.]
MDAHQADMIASMLQELGIDVTSSELESDNQPSLAPMLKSVSHHPMAECDEPRQLASFEHMTHLQPERSRIPYKRSTHFAAHLAQLCGRVDTSAVFPKGIIRRLRRSGVKPAEPAAYFRCRRLLKRWGYSSPQYRCIFALLKQMGGPILHLTYAQEYALRRDFERVCSLFDWIKPLGPSRKNLISYYLITQLLLKKYSIPCYYVLPSIKDKSKFESLVQAYCSISNATLVD